MLSMINNFRAGNWWIWKGDGTKYYGSNLPALKYNYNLEKIAMVRAAELAIRTDHLRPDDSYIFEIDGVFGENIAWGQTSAKQAYTEWLEENAKTLNGQGHRYNMLTHACIGIGHAIYKGKHYWVQAFSDYDLTSDYTQPYNSNINVNIDVTDAVLKSMRSRKMDFKVLGWQKDKTGWWYYKEDGSYPKNDWLKINNKWYFFNDKGYMVTGWRKINNRWYYFEQSGAMRTNWNKIKGIWYYFDANGKMVTGWNFINNKWYYFNKSGAMLTNWYKINNKWYYFDHNGAMHTSWLKLNNVWYFFKDSGEMVTGFENINDSTYCFDENGAMLTGKHIIEDNEYIFNDNGKLVSGVYLVKL